MGFSQVPGSSGAWLTALHLCAQQSVGSDSPPLTPPPVWGLLFRGVLSLEKGVALAHLQLWRSGWRALQRTPTLMPQRFSIITSAAHSLVTLAFVDLDHIRGWTVFVSWLSIIFCHVSLTQSVMMRISYKKPGRDKPRATYRRDKKKYGECLNWENLLQWKTHCH